MDFSIPPDSFFEFISANIKEDPKRLLLKNHGKDLGFDIGFTITQIECRRKGHHKLPDFIGNTHALFPSALAYEQASNEGVAKFHASLLSPGDAVIDMTAGLGIDSLAFARQGCCVTACEMDRLKAKILCHNAKIFGLDERLSVINADSTTYIKECAGKVDVIFVDPARRSDTDRRLYNMHDCTPDILAIQDQILQKCKTLLIKASPLLDVTRTLKDIPTTKKISVVSVAGECKEVLVEAAEGSSLEFMRAIDLRPDGVLNYSFCFTPGGHANKVQFATDNDLCAGAYLYEPGGAVMKLTPWDKLSFCFPSLRKLGASSHLFVSPKLIEEFPGRILRIQSIIDKKSRKAIKGSPANVVVRNYPLSADELRKKLGVREGKDLFIYASRLGDTPILIKCVRI